MLDKYSFQDYKPASNFIIGYAMFLDNEKPLLIVNDNLKKDRDPRIKVLKIGDDCHSTKENDIVLINSQNVLTFKFKDKEVIQFRETDIIGYVRDI